MKKYLLILIVAFLMNFFSLAVFAQDSLLSISTGPTITNMSCNKSLSDCVALVEWFTSESSDSLVEFGIDEDSSPSYDYFVEDNTLKEHHQVLISGLLSGYKYNFRVGSSQDTSNDTVFSENYQFETSENVDLLPPVILRGPNVVSVSGNKAVIWWVTDEVSNSVIEYGLEKNYEYTIEIEDSFQRYHEIEITGLKPKSLYHYRVASKDYWHNGNTYSSDQTFFTGYQDKSGSVIIKGPVISSTSNNSVVIEWETDQLETSYVDYGTQRGQYSFNSSSSSQVITHQRTLSSLQNSTQYFYLVDDDGGKSITIFEKDFNTPSSADNLAPVLISGPTVTAVTTNKVIIEWWTDELSDSTVFYYQEGSKEPTWEDWDETEPCRFHQIIGRNLNSSATYNFYIESKDLYNNNLSTSDDIQEFSTSSNPDLTAPINSNIEIIYAATEIALLQWNSNEPATSRVEYDNSIGSYAGLREDSQYNTTHQVYLPSYESEGIARLRTTDLAGNISSWTELDLPRASSDQTSPTISSAPSAEVVSGSGTSDAIVEITWNTNESADSTVYYGTSSQNLNRISEEMEDVESHSIFLTHIDTYEDLFYKVCSADPVGNEPTCSQVYQLE